MIEPSDALDGTSAGPRGLRVGVTLTGRVEEGVEHRSVVLRGDDGRLWQVGAACSRVVGRRVRVTGRPREGMLTTAMQGVPFAVEDVVVLDEPDTGESRHA